MKKLTIFAIIASILFSCKEKEPHFTIQGKIAGAKDSTFLYLEKRSIAEISVIDSVMLGNDGKYKFEEPAAIADFYVLRLNGQMINLAVDSTETITLNASSQSFATDYTVEGSETSAKIKIITTAQAKLSSVLKDLEDKHSRKEINDNQYIEQLQTALNEYKDKSTSIIRSDYNSLAAYYALFQKAGDYLIFDPYEKADRSLFQAVATVWKQKRPDTPRSIHLENFTLGILAGIRQMANQEKALQRLTQADVTDESAYFDITLPDIYNKDITLSSLKGKIVILDFTAYQTEYSPAHNIMLNQIYTKYKPKLEIYQISFDTNEHQWRNAAVNLHWICVRDDRFLQSPLLQKYNVQGFPTTFLLDKQGQVIQRITSTGNLEAAIQKIL